MRTGASDAPPRLHRAAQAVHRRVRQRPVRRPPRKRPHVLTCRITWVGDWRNLGRRLEPDMVAAAQSAFRTDWEHLALVTTDRNHRQALSTTSSDPRYGIEGTGAQLVGGIREDQVQALPRSAVLPVPAGGHQSAMQLIVGCVQHLEQRQLPEHQEEPVLERCPSVISRPRKLPDGNQSMATRTLPACG